MSTTIAGDTRPIRLECMEIWGGNQVADSLIAVPGIDARVISTPFGGDPAGGDMYYVSTCGSGRIGRFALADVSGHGRQASETAVKLRRLMRKHLNRLDQTRFARDLNQEFSALAREGTFATAILVSYYGPTDHLIVCNAGHPPPLWYRPKTETWQPLVHTMSERARRAANLPLGVIEPTSYSQFAVQLDIGDLVLLYSDALIEAADPAGKLLGAEGFHEIVAGMDVARPESFCHDLLDRISAYRDHAPAEDDETVVLLQHNGGDIPSQSLGDMVKVMGKMLGLVKV